MLRDRTLFSALAVASIFGATAPLACEPEAAPLADGPTYADRVRLVLDAKCASCHAGSAPAAGYRTDSYRGAIGCTTDGRRGDIAAALARDDHRGVVTDDERALLLRWVAAGSPGVRAGVHPARFADPRSPDGHVQALRGRRHSALFDPNDRESCARCHDGAGPRPAGVTTTAPGATPCTSCHAEPQGALACTTCHGAPGRAYPPRDACFFPPPPEKASVRDPHGAHAGPSRSSASGIDCAACHPKPAGGAFGGTHGDGYVEVWLDGAVAGVGAAMDPATTKCTGTCHDRGGARPGPVWRADVASPPLGCGDCHGAPPASHYPGPCSHCHREADDRGAALVAPKLHVNGRVDRGDGSGRCGACHGDGDSPWPKTGAHLAHERPAGSKPVACETCHVPHGGDRHPLRAGAPVVTLAGLSTKGGAQATYDPVTKTCAATYCHEQRGGTKTAPRWTDGEAARACGTCHGTPPPSPHPQDASCKSCHTIDAAVHVDGLVQR